MHTLMMTVIATRWISEHTVLILPEDRATVCNTHCFPGLLSFASTLLQPILPHP